MADARAMITLTTDFGTSDHYTGSVKGAILTINPAATIVDISHTIPPYDIAHGAFVIGSVFDLFPPGTIHVGVIDPGVGSERLPILIRTENYFFVGPDNGLFSMVPLKEKVTAIYHLSKKTFFRDVVSTTFHGRDIFSPVASHLSRGIEPHLFGHRIKGLQILPLFHSSVSPGGIDGAVMAIDRFGNAILNISRRQFEQIVGKKPFSLAAGGRKFSKIHQTYASLPKGLPGLVFGSEDWLEIAMFQDSAAKKLKMKTGTRATLR